jgi:hypothetical protein
MDSVWGTIMQIKQCAACRQAFQLRAQTPQQRYCSSPECQRERRRKWQKEKLKNDSDYKDNQARAQQEWSKRNSDYWHNYRSTHPEYVERNRVLQRERNTRSKNDSIVKMDLSNPHPTLPSGIYHLSLVKDSEIVKMDAWMVEIRVLSHLPEPVPKIAKR